MRLSFSLILLLLVLLNARAQQRDLAGRTLQSNPGGAYNLVWQTLPAANGKQALTFERAQYFNSNIPWYTLFEKAPAGTGTAEITLINPVYAPLTTAEQALVPADSISNSPVIRTFITRQKKEEYLAAVILPFRKNPASGQIEKLISFDIQKNYNSSTLQKSAPAPTATTSVLASGSFYLLGVTSDGVYKVDYTMLEKMGLDPAAINLSTAGIFGQPGGMNPWLNNQPKKDDLLELHVVLEDGGDGIFNQGDYFLFYGQSPHRWKKSNAGFYKENHLYSDTTYYFFSPDAAAGLRISAPMQVSATPTHQVSSFQDLQIHEVDKVNLIKSGRRFFGENFEYTTVQDFGFDIPDIHSSFPARITIETAARSQDITSFKLTVNGIQDNFDMDTTPFANIYGHFAKDKTHIFNYNNPSSPLQIKLDYQKTPNSIAWLDFIQVESTRHLNYRAPGLLFRDTVSAGPGKVARFNITGLQNGLLLWDVTNPLEPRPHQLISGGFTNYADNLREYYLFNPALAITPVYHGQVANQNLHALPQQEMVIVVHPPFKPAAEELASIHSLDGLTVTVVTTRQVYNEFSGGVPEAQAIRDFMKMFYDRATGTADMPKYLLLIGDGSFDNRSRAPGHTSFIPTFESIESLELISSFVTDDFYGMLDPSEGMVTTDLLDIAIGRFPVKSLSETQAIVDKIKHYKKEATMRPWRNSVSFIADDGDGSYWVSQSEILSNNINITNPEYDVDKIYLDAYQQEYTAGGQRYPDASEAFNRRVEKGALIMNYIGHGGETGLAHEQMLTVSHIKDWKNINNLPLFFTATCEFSRFDDHTRTSAGEYALLNPDGGGIGLMTTVRVVSGSSNFTLNTEFFKHALDDAVTTPTMGDIFFKTKSPFNGPNSRNFTFLGDPALRLAYPKHNVVTTEINGKNVSVFTDTIRALSLVTIKGYVSDVSGQKLSTFNGTIYPTVFDKKSNLKTLSNDGPSESPELPFSIWKNIVYRGKASVVNGDFTFSFVVPKDINYDFGTGRISYYAENDITDAHGYSTAFRIGGTDSTAVADETGPEVELYMNDIRFIFGGMTDENPNLLGILHDEHGINTTGTGVGHDITAILDGNTEKTLVLNDYYEADLDDYKSGKVLFPFSELKEGRHTLRLKAWDVYNNSAEDYTEFVVSKSAEIALEHVLNYPNPFTTYTEFWFEHNQPATQLDVQVQVFTVSGKLVKTLEAFMHTEGYRSEPIPWDGLDDFGDKIGRGVYVYRIKVKGPDGSWADKFEKLVILR